jgi:chromosome segregation ATPase
MGRIENMFEEWEITELKERVWVLEKSMKDAKADLADIRLYLQGLALQASKSEELLQRLINLLERLFNNLERLFDHLEQLEREFYEIYNLVEGKR